MKQAYWIWIADDYEIYHLREVNLRRQEFGVDYPPFWSLSSPYAVAKFIKEIDCNGGSLTAYCKGQGYIVVDSQRYPMGVSIPLSPGHHRIRAELFKRDGLPALYVESNVCPSDGSWICSHNAGDLKPVGWNKALTRPDQDPEVFPFSYAHKEPVSVEKTVSGRLFDFGDELFGYLDIAGSDGQKMKVFYGESREEALDPQGAILFEEVEGASSYRLRQRAFRYIHIVDAPENLVVTAEHEYLPLEAKGSFSCDNELFNEIYRVCVKTFHLNCREGFLDGIKRDRWVWGGDAYQSARINGYLFADQDIVKRTTIGILGKLPVEQHINTILDYSFFWLIGLYEQYMTYGDIAFLKKMFHRAKALLEFCETRLNESGFVVGKKGDYSIKTGDWTFIDWSDIDKTGAVCAEQMLLVAAYRYMNLMSAELGLHSDYAKKADALLERINAHYWNEEKGAFIDSYESGRNNVTRHANIFAVMYDLATPLQIESILKNVLKNDAVTKITTPYFRGYELDVLGKLGEFSEIEDALEHYWGAMLGLGATTIWEEFDPTLQGVEHYAMYRNSFGKSLCHAWGAGPVYLFGRYYLGVYPTAPGFKTFRVEPNPGSLREFSGVVPAGDGLVRVEYQKGMLRVMATIPGGTLSWQGTEYPLKPNEELLLPCQKQMLFG